MSLKTLKDYNSGQIDALCGDVLHAASFQRLSDISFLGILSPTYNTICQYVSKDVSKQRSYSYDDGSRAQHSIGVAIQLLNFAKQNRLSKRTQKYAICWGLLHDIATWPLSHTSEVAFTKIFKRSSAEIRSMMILGDQEIPEKYRVAAQLSAVGVNPEILVKLFSKRRPPLDDVELMILWDFVHSPLTPDTLEGIWRSGKVYQIDVPNPIDLCSKIKTREHKSYIKAHDFDIFLDFWEQKARIYREVINDKETIKIESNWSNSIFEYYQYIDLAASFELSEADILDKVKRLGLVNTNKTIRYKKPSIYFISHRNRDFTIEIALEMAQTFLKRKNQSSNVFGSIQKFFTAKNIRHTQ